jgi:hypothetical protein
MANIEHEVLPDEVIQLIYDYSRFLRPDWRTCKRDEARIIEQHYRAQIRIHVNDVIVIDLADLGLS